VGYSYFLSIIADRPSQIISQIMPRGSSFGDQKRRAALGRTAEDGCPHIWLSWVAPEIIFGIPFIVSDQ
jgi:hypothetical protein